jgi:hypothetical protein
MSSKESEDSNSDVEHINEEVLQGVPPEGLIRNPEDELYPDIEDDNFINKLLRKREFRESKQGKLTDQIISDDSTCDVKEFEYTPVQRFVSQYLSPKTPYNGMLLYHGVGVGKTCTAVITAEAFLELSPKNKVFILAPPAIQSGFYRTIFDTSRVVFGDGELPNRHDGCTGNIYLELAQCLYETDIGTIESKVNRIIKKRYSIMGYVAFRNMILELFSRIPPSLPTHTKREQEKRILQRTLSGSLFIIDEAHNLRDGLDDDPEEIGEINEKDDSTAGKKLTPFLKKVLKTCDGLKLLLMTATPMYNSYTEIISLLNLLLIADHVDDSQLLTETSIRFHTPPEENPPRERLTPESEQRIIKIANGRVSFMRGENPKAFPARLEPKAELRVSSWVSKSVDDSLLQPPVVAGGVLSLPLVKCELNNDSLEVIRHITETLVTTKGVGIRTIDTILQAGNCIFPGEGMEGRYGSEGFRSMFSLRTVPGRFKETRISTLPQYTAIDSEDYPSTLWMAKGANLLKKYSPKINLILNTLQSSTGISFVYSRFVETGAVLFCLFLEANGYLPWGRSVPLFSKGVVTPSGLQCSKCEKRQKKHPEFNSAEAESRENHVFTPAYYALLTASSINIAGTEYPLCPNKDSIINAARSKSNKDGSEIKVIVGSEVAGEGLDLRAIREIHILEGWFHLSKEEQIIGRGIRYCSHQDLPKEQRNCTIYLYVNVFPASEDKETIDLYSYRKAMDKAIRIGNISRALKQGAVDCNLNRESILISGLRSVDMIDSQGTARSIDINDKNYTNICDWQECEYSCIPNLQVSELDEDSRTYDIFSARFTEQKLLYVLKALFKEKVAYSWKEIESIFRQQISKDITLPTLSGLLYRAINNPGFILENGSAKGSLIYKNDLFLFQPYKIRDSAIPMALRWGKYPVKRDSYVPEKLKAGPIIVQATTVVPVEEKKEEGMKITAAHIEPIKQFWNTANAWIDTWTSGTMTIEENISSELMQSIRLLVHGNADKIESIETRLKKLQWLGKSIMASWGSRLMGGGGGGSLDPNNELKDLADVSRQFIWDTFIRGEDQVALIMSNVSHLDIVANEQIVQYESRTMVRFVDLESEKMIYINEQGQQADKAEPAIFRVFRDLKDDLLLNERANQRITADFYGFMVPWNKQFFIFKTNDRPALEGKDPGRGLACSLISTIKTHFQKLERLGKILLEKTGNDFSLTDQELIKGARKLSGAQSYCALFEIVLRWMDKRRDILDRKRFFYRPIASYYSKHRVSKE